MFAARLANTKTASPPAQALPAASLDQARSGGGMRSPRSAAHEAAEPVQKAQAGSRFADQKWNFGRISIFSSRERNGMSIASGIGSAEPMPISSGARFEGRLQAKLEVGPVDDPLEREADQMADRVVRAPDAQDENGNGPVRASVAAGVPRMQRKCATCEHEDEGQGKLQRKCSACEQEEEQHKIARKAVSGARVTGGTDVSPAVGEVLRSPGRPLENSVRGFFEERFGSDFAQVRVHTDAKAAASARSVGALAYTVGSHIVFGRSHFDASTPGGRHLLAHELAHTVQQGSARDLAGGRMKASSTGERMQRQPAAGVHELEFTSGPPPGVSFEKWSPDVEAMYRRNGLVDAANAVRRCRQGSCEKVLTEAEAYEAYRSGRLKAGLGEAAEKTAKVGSGAGGVAAVPAVAAVAAPAAAPAAAGAAPAAAPAAESAAARAAARWAPQAARAAAAAARAAPAAEAAPAAAPGVAAATVAIPIALGIYVTVAIIDLVGYTSFQAALQRQGFVILPPPLQVCISGCHQPQVPSDPFGGPEGSGWFGGPSGIPQFPGDNDDAIRKWIESQPGTPAPTPAPADPQAPQSPEASRRRPARPAPTPTPVTPPVPATPPRPRSTKCTEKEQTDLYNEVDKQCKNRGGFGCKPTDTYQTAVEKIAKLNGCISARETYQQKCWKKGDPGYEGHMQQIADLYKILRHCEEIAKKKMSAP